MGMTQHPHSAIAIFNSKNRFRIRNLLREKIRNSLNEKTAVGQVLNFF